MNWSDKLNLRIIRCRSCPRLVQWREEVAREKKRAYRDWEYWGRAVPSFGDPQARVLIVGLAPGAHGANRTGRMFTGDSSGQWLYRALHKAGFANQPSWERRDDGLRLRDCYITAACHCAPPGNKPLPAEIANCNRYLREELEKLKRLRVVIALGKIAFDTYCKTAGISPVPVFAHNAVYRLDPCSRGVRSGRAEADASATGIVLIASSPPSRQNTNTGKLTEPMLDAVFAGAVKLLSNLPED